MEIHKNTKVINAKMKVMVKKLCFFFLTICRIEFPTPYPFKKLFSAVFIVAFMLFSVVLFGQERMTDFQNKMALLKSNAGLLKLRNSYLEKYQQTKNTENIAYSRYAEMYLHNKDTLGNIKRAYEVIRYSKETSELRSRGYFGLLFS